MSIKHQLTVAIELDQIPQGVDGQGFKDKQAIIDWISSCLNINTNHVKAKVAEAEQASAATVVIEMDDGLINVIRADQATRVITLDSDLEGADEDYIDEIDGNEVYWCDHFVQVEPERVRSIANEIDALEAN